MTEREWLPNAEPQDNERTWLDRLAPGDEVIVQESGRDTIAVVYRRLAAGGLLVSWSGTTREFTFDGRLRTSGTYTSTYLAEPTLDRKRMLEKQHLARSLAEQHWHCIPLDTLRQIFALVQNDAV